MFKLQKLSILIISFLVLTGCDVLYTSNKQLKTYTHKSEKVLLICDDLYGELEVITNIIQSKVSCTLYSIGDYQKPDMNQYDIILIGTTLIEDEPSVEMIDFLNQMSLKNQKVSTYWIGAMNNQIYESHIKQYIKSNNILPGLGFNNDEISEKELITYFIDEWLLMIY
jgi:hypothetical protein